MLAKTIQSQCFSDSHHGSHYIVYLLFWNLSYMHANWLISSFFMKTPWVTAGLISLMNSKWATFHCCYKYFLSKTYIRMVQRLADFQKYLWTVYSLRSWLCRICKFAPCLRMLLPKRSKHFLKKIDGWMDTNCCAFYFFACCPAWHFQVSRRGIFCGAPTQLSRRALWRGTHKTSCCIQEERTQETHIWGGLSLWHFRYGLLNICMLACN